jgi:hypothetical protein
VTNRPARALLLLALVPVHAAAAPPADPAGKPTAAQETLLLDVRRDLGSGYTIEPVEDLYVVAANTDREQLERSKSTVRDAYRALTRTYFEKKPDRPIAIYLFRDKLTYEDYCVRHYKESPSTPYGFFRPDERKLVMNIATGGGTLVHEMVHPFIAVDFPGAPPWLNEGLASLYEQCQIHAGTIKGLVNWRLPHLQRAVLGNTLIPLKDLLPMASEEFYRRYGLPYAESRYLCLFLQEQGKLVAFYKAFRAAAASEDPSKKDTTGTATLEAVMGRPIGELETIWIDWVKTLRWGDR